MTFSFHSSLDRLVSQDCTLCGARTGSPLCGACEKDLPHLAVRACPQCAAVSPDGDVCGQCLRNAPRFDAAIAAFQYEFPFDRLMQAYKFRAHLALADVFGAALAARVRGLPVTFDTVVPLPLAPSRLAVRGFDQTALIAHAFAQRLPGIRLARQLIKVRDTPPQSGLDREARLKNVRGAFACAADLDGAHVAILDDVMTTGATLSEAAHALKRAGAARITALAVARADHSGLAGRAIPF